MIIETKNVRVEEIDSEKFVVYTGKDALCSQKELSELEPGDVFVADEKKFAVLWKNVSFAGVVEVGELEERKFDSNTNNWELSDLRNYLNIEVLKKYDDLFGKDNIVETTTILDSLDGLDDYGECEDKIRLMNFEEYRRYQDFIKRGDAWEWLLTPWSTPKRDVDYSVCCVSPSGCFYYNYCFLINAVRPFCILKSNILVSVEEN